MSMHKRYALIGLATEWQEHAAETLAHGRKLESDALKLTTMAKTATDEMVEILCVEYLGLEDESEEDEDEDADFDVAEDANQLTITFPEGSQVFPGRGGKA